MPDGRNHITKIVKHAEVNAKANPETEAKAFGEVSDNDPVNAKEVLEKNEKPVKHPKNKKEAVKTNSPAPEEKEAAFAHPKTSQEAGGKEVEQTVNE